MPQYLYKCNQCGDNVLRWCPVKIFTNDPHLQCLACDMPMEVVIQAPLLVKASADVRYTSPIDDAPITSWAAREEDLKRNGCRPYDDGMKQDYHTRLSESEAALDKAVEADVEKAIEKMPTAKRGKLYSELVEQGTDANVIRTSAHG